MAYQSWSVVFGEQPSAAKWNLLGTNDAHFYGFLGDNENWQSWVPTWTNLTVGNGTVTATYGKVGNSVPFRILVVFGSTTSISGSVSFSLPFTVATWGGTSTYDIGLAHYEDTGTGNFHGFITVNSAGTTGTFRLSNASGTYITATNLSSTVPHTWANTDEIFGVGMFESST